MESPGTPKDEEQRLAELKALGLLDTPPEDRFDRVTRLARRSLGTPMALFSLVDADRQWFKSAQGLSASQTGRDVSICGHAILQDEVFVVEDTTADERFAGNPLVTGEPNIRFYAGRPVRGPDGHRIGTLCVLDRNVRKWTQEDTDVLEDCARIIESEVKIAALNASEQALRDQLDDAQRRAALDETTRAWTRAIVLRVLDQELDRFARAGSPMALLLVRPDQLSGAPQQAQAGVLGELADRIRSAVRSYDSVGRYSDDTFLIVLPECGVELARAIAGRIRQRVIRKPVALEGAGYSGNHTVAIGAFVVKGSSAALAADVLANVEQALKRCKADSVYVVEPI